MRIFLTIMTILVTATLVSANECLYTYKLPQHISSLVGLNSQSQRLLMSNFSLQNFYGNSPVFYFRGGELAIASNGNSAEVFVVNSVPRYELENYAAKFNLSTRYVDIFKREITPQNELISARQFFITLKTLDEVNAFIHWIATSRLAWNQK